MKTGSGQYIVQDHKNNADEIKNLLRRMIENGETYALYQPIMDIQRSSLFGLEALLRVDEKYGLTPLDLFSMAKAADMTYELDMTALQAAIQSFSAEYGNNGVKLFLNVLPSTLLHPQFLHDFRRLLSSFGMSGQQIMLEINENEMIANFASLKERIHNLRQLNVSVVLDDVGSGYSIQMMTELETDMIKIDRFLVEDVDRSDKKQRVIRLICEVTDHRLPIVAEGIEREQELEFLKKLGIQLGQGYFLGKPSSLRSIRTEF